MAAPAGGAGEAVRELTYAGMAALFRWSSPDDETGEGACLPLTRLLLAGLATMSISTHDVYSSALPLGRLGSTPGSVGQSQTQYKV